MPTLFWSGESISADSSGLGIPSGHDCAAYAGLERALALYAQTGPENVHRRSTWLGEVMAPELSRAFHQQGIDDAPIAAHAMIAFDFKGFDSFPLYAFLNERQIHLKCIKNTLYDGTSQSILRFGFPYYEGQNRLQTLIGVIDEFFKQQR